MFQNPDLGNVLEHEGRPKTDARSKICGKNETSVTRSCHLNNPAWYRIRAHSVSLRH
ncbi:hypothetical protein ACHAWF_012594, partial [Thalassiosira exigua]